MNAERRTSPASVFLTFDDGPDPEWTPQILDLLARAQVRATFFAVGQLARSTPALLRRAAAEGHVIGNHTFSHRHPWTMLSATARSEVRRGAEIIEDILGGPVSLYRAPHGRVRRCMSDQAARCGQRVVGWTLSAIDWGPFGTAPRIAARLDSIGADDIVLMHDGRNEHNRPDQLVQVLPQMLQQLTRKGLVAAPLA